MTTEYLPTEFWPGPCSVCGDAATCYGCQQARQKDRLHSFALGVFGHLSSEEFEDLAWVINELETAGMISSNEAAALRLRAQALSQAAEAFMECVGQVLGTSIADDWFALAPFDEDFQGDDL